jgi:type I restriction enzyme S subunit
MPSDIWTSGVSLTLSEKQFRDPRFSWLVEKPADWKLTKLKHIALVQSGEMPPENKSHLEGDYPVYGANGVIGYCGNFNLKREAIIIGRVGTTGAVNRATGKVWISDNALIVYLDHKKADLAFVEYLLTLRDLGAAASKSAQPLITSTIVRNIDVLLPPLPTQRAIAEYLDRETARLDALVETKERVLELLAEKRRALITRVVTLGLDSCAALRDSGILWLGQIPSHWEPRRIAHLFCERDERGEPELPLLEVSINAGVVLREFSDDRIESTAADFNSYKVARKSDIVFNKMRMWQGAVGVAPEDGLVSPDYTVAEPIGGMSSAYAGQLFRTEMFSAECARNSHGIVWDRLRLYWDEFRDIVVPLPTVEEQEAIVAHIASETAQLDALRSATERTIALLKERRTALIAAAVTGNLSVDS